MPLPPNLNKMLEQAQQMQAEMEAAQEKLKDERVEASAGGGMVKVTATGEGLVHAIEIDPDAVDPDDVELLQDMVMAAVNEAMRQADEVREKATAGAQGDFDPSAMLGDLGGLLGGGMGGLGGPGGPGGPGGGGLPGGMPPGAGGGNRAARRANKKNR